MNEIASAIEHALNMPREEQQERNKFMQERIKRYDIKKWASDFMKGMANVKSLQEKYLGKKLTNHDRNTIYNKYLNADKRILFLDYDGTLVNYERKPQHAKPDNDLYSLLDKLSQQEGNEIVIISSRDKDIFERWFGHTQYNLIAEHGMWIKENGNDWAKLEEDDVNTEWKKFIKPAIQFYVDRTPGSFLEEKTFSMAWHYRKTDPDLGQQRAIDLKEELASQSANLGLEIVEGNKVIEIKNSDINKGKAANHKIKKGNYDFVMAIGDDWTDEDLFGELGQDAITMKVGLKNTRARYSLESFQEVRNLLKELIATYENKYDTVNH